MSPNPVNQGSSSNREEAMDEDCKLKELDDPADCRKRLPLARSGSILRRPFCFLLVATLFLVTAHRLPAPITEIPESPTPTPTVAPTATPKPKTLPKPKPKSEASASATNPVRRQPSSKQSRFAGTWVGTMQTIPWGNWAVVLLIDANEATMSEQINGEKPIVRPARRNGEMLQARFPAGLTTITWSLTPQSDGTTANVRFEAFMNDFSAVFRRTADAPSISSSTTPIALATPKTPQGEIPTAKAVPGKPGFVYNPFDPTAQQLLDVRGKASGTKVKDPTSGKLFIVP